MNRFRRSLFGLGLGIALLGGCAEDDASPLGAPFNTQENLFARYVSLGNSITAGFQSNGINANTQREAYPVLLAAQAGARFNAPLLELPGCPPPLADPLSGQTIAPGVTCLLRDPASIRAPIHNLAVPGARIASALDITAAANVLTTLILGGQTPIEAMVDADPTLVSVWLGNNDALGAALSGNLGPALAGADSTLTPLPEFRGSLGAIVSVIDDQTSAQEVILIGVVDPTLAPALQPGAFFFAARQAGLLPKPVSNNCAPGTPGSRNQVSIVALRTDAITEISCADDAPFVLNQMEQQIISQRVAAFNEAIQEAADENDWLYLNPNLLLGQFLTRPDLLRKCQGLATATTPQQFQIAVATTCPGPSAPNFYGALISFDGVHPSGLAHRVITNALIEMLNAENGLNIPMIATGL